VARDLEARAIAVRDLEGEGCMEPEAQARDGGARARMVEGGGRLEEAPDLLQPQHGGEPGGGLRAQERQRRPVTRQDVLREEAEAPGAAAYGRGGEAIDVLPVYAGALQGLCSEAGGCGVIDLGQEADCSARGCRSPFALAVEMERRDHVLTQRGHEISPFGRCVVGLRRKTSETDEGRKRGLRTAASAAYLNNALQQTAYSLRCAAASGSC